MDLALAFFEMQLFAPAVSELKLIQAHDPYFAEAQCLLGQVRFAEKSFLLALEAFQTALRDSGENTRLKSDAEYQLIKVYLKLEDFGKAMVHLRELEEREGDYRDLKRIKEVVAAKLGVDALPKARSDKKLRKTG
jgi:tetratricopeptide (TPR) repeat protein